MSFTDIFIRRPVLASVVSLLILLVGLQCAFKLQVRQFPELSSTTITITTSYPGANADVVKGYITTPIAQAVASAEGIDTLVSSSQQNASTITLGTQLNCGLLPNRANCVPAAAANSRWVWPATRTMPCRASKVSRRR